MDSIKYLLTEVGVQSATITIFATILAFQSAFNLIDWFCSKIGIETKRSLKNKAESERIKEHEETLHKIIKDIKGTNDKLNVLSQMFVEMQEKTDASERARLKDRIGEMYRIYDERKSWTKMEKDAFEDLISDYERHGGKNSFVHSVCEQEYPKWAIVHD